MADEPDNLVLLRLRDLRGRIDQLRDGLEYLSHRLEALETRASASGTDAAANAAFSSSIERRVRRLEDRLELGDD